MPSAEAAGGNGSSRASTPPLPARRKGIWSGRALLYAGPEAMVTGPTACRAYGLRYVPATGGPELLVPEHVQRAPMAIATIHRTRVLPVPRDVHSFPCAPP